MLPDDPPDTRVARISDRIVREQDVHLLSELQRHHRDPGAGEQRLADADVGVHQHQVLPRQLPDAAAHVFGDVRQAAQVRLHHPASARVPADEANVGRLPVDIVVGPFLSGGLLHHRLERQARVLQQDPRDEDLEQVAVPLSEPVHVVRTAGRSEHLRGGLGAVELHVLVVELPPEVEEVGVRVAPTVHPDLVQLLEGLLRRADWKRPRFMPPKGEVDGMQDRPVLLPRPCRQSEARHHEGVEPHHVQERVGPRRRRPVPRGQRGGSSCRLGVRGDSSRGRPVVLLRHAALLEHPHEAVLGRSAHAPVRFVDDFTPLRRRSARQEPQPLQPLDAGFERGNGILRDITSGKEV